MIRLVQEGMNNALKHAKATSVWINLEYAEGEINISFEDDGEGFEVNKKSKGIGLQNMISRTNECHGIFDVKSEKGKGTSIIITIPYENNKIKTEKE